MLLGLIERGMPIDCVLFCDTGIEFPAMYEHIDKVEKQTGITITRVKPEHSFEYLMFDYRVKRKNSDLPKRGFSWAGPRQRWCTNRLKNIPRSRFLREIRKKYEVFEYVGIAADEQHRLERKCNRDKHHIHPLIDWGMTESDCLKYCYDRGYDWGGLYEHFKRVSCWCCPLQSLDELRQLYNHYPDLWEQLKKWDSMTWRTFLKNYSVEQLEIRFELEKEFLQKGLSIRNRDFFTEMRKRFDLENAEFLSTANFEDLFTF